MELLTSPELAGERLDVALAASVGSRSKAGRLVDAGLVTVDGLVKPRRFRLQEGMRIVVDLAADPLEQPTDAEAVAAVPYAIAYEDDDLLVVDKPAGVVVHPARGVRGGTLIEALRARGAAGGDEADRPGLVHRLDRDTSGLLVVAKSDAVHHALQEALRHRLVQREYVALVDGRPPARTGTIDAPIGRDRHVRTRQSTDTDHPREAVTHFSLEEALPQHTLLEIRLATGRTHQIRVHLQAIGHPVAGDPEYGKAELGLERQFLHARRLAFTHPVSGDEVEVRSPLPDELGAALRRARG